MFFIIGLFMTMNQIIYRELSAQCSAQCGNSIVTAIVVACCRLPHPNIMRNSGCYRIACLSVTFILSYKEG